MLRLNTMSNSCKLRGAKWLKQLRFCYAHPLLASSSVQLLDIVSYSALSPPSLAWCWLLSKWFYVSSSAFKLCTEIAHKIDLTICSASQQRVYFCRLLGCTSYKENKKCDISFVDYDFVENWQDWTLFIWFLRKIKRIAFNDLTVMNR